MKTKSEMILRNEDVYQNLLNKEKSFKFLCNKMMNNQQSNINKKKMFLKTILKMITQKINQLNIQLIVIHSLI